MLSQQHPSAILD